MDHFDFNVVPEHDVSFTNDAGQEFAHAHPDGLGYTLSDAGGGAVGYDHPFGGVDHFLDSHMQEVGTLDALGTLHNAAGETTGHVILVDGGVEVTNIHNEVIARTMERFGR